MSLRLLVLVVMCCVLRSVHTQYGYSYAQQRILGLTSTWQNADHCVFQGQFYRLGESIPAARRCPEQQCMCGHHGQVTCPVVDCPSAPCVDAVSNQSVHCCPYCPKGPNCYYGNTIIQENESILIDSFTECECTHVQVQTFSHKAHCYRLPLPPPTPSSTSTTTLTGPIVGR